MFIETELLRKTREYAQSLLSGQLPEHFYYHDLSHTRHVVEAAREIGKKSNLDKKDMETVLIAAWLHDIGYSSHTTEHEAAGAEMARIFLQENEVGLHRIEKIVDCILATKIPQHPENLLAEVLCDADLYHLSSDAYFEKSELLRRELSITKGREIATEEWLLTNVDFFNEHVFFTEYGKSALQPGKEKNLKKLEKKIRKGEEKETDQSNKEVEKLEKELQKLRAKLDEEKPNRPGRGVETMFRTTSSNHLQLSNIADNKANIMISINSIIVSLLVSVLIRKFEEFPNLIAPTAILTTVCLMTIVFAVLATRPNVSLGRFSREDIYSKKANLLFFGNFHQMSLEDYEWGMKETIKDNDLLYTSMIHDIYFLGKVLGRKYRLLRISYNIFMYGFVFSVVSYAVALIFFPVHQF